MGVCNRPYIPQEETYELFYGFNTLCAYIYDAPVITKDDFADHMKALEIVLQKLAKKGLKVNAQTQFFGRTET